MDVFKIKTKYMKRFILLLGISLPVLAFAQFSGRVVNINNEGIPYANVVVKNNSIGTTTDSTGHFSLPDIQKFPFTLIVSYAGFEPQERVIRNNNANNILIQLQVLYQRD